MRAIVQRVSEASVAIDGERVGGIGSGLALLVGIHREDTVQDAVRLADRIAGLRIFGDEEGKMNLSLKQLPEPGEVLAVSNFTVYGDAIKSRRPSFVTSAGYEVGKELFDRFVLELEKLDVKVRTGVFGADMKVSVANDGPVTLVVDTR